jgi:hypothetical protein
MDEVIVKQYLLLGNQNIWEADHALEPSLEMQALGLLGVISIEPSYVTSHYLWIRNLTDREVILTFRRKEPSSS